MGGTEQVSQCWSATESAIRALECWSAAESAIRALEITAAGSPELETWPDKTGSKENGPGNGQQQLSGYGKEDS